MLWWNRTSSRLDNRWNCFAQCNSDTIDVLEITVFGQVYFIICKQLLVWWAGHQFYDWFPEAECCQNLVRGIRLNLDFSSLLLARITCLWWWSAGNGSNWDTVCNRSCTIITVSVAMTFPVSNVIFSSNYQEHVGGFAVSVCIYCRNVGNSVEMFVLC